MQEEFKPNYSDPSAPLPGAPAPDKGPFSLGAADRALLLPAALMALLFCLVYEMPRLVRTGWFPGLGGGVFFLALGAAALFAGRGLWKRSPGALVLSLSYLLLSLSFITDGDPLLRFFNLGVTPLVGLMAAAALRQGPGSLRLSCFCNALRRFFRNLFPRFGWPLRVLVQGERAGRRAVLLGLAAALPLAAVVLALLSSADAVFAHLLQGLFSWGDGALWLWRGLKWLLAFGLGFSLLTALNRPPLPLPVLGKAPALPAAFLCTVLTVLDLIYAAFLAVQFRYFFGGAETAAMEGGYAQYARSGFFQLVAVALLNLGLALPLAPAARRSRGVALLGSLLVLATGVITLSALLRMNLYVQVYGLSLLRLITYWGIGVIALFTLAALWRLWAEDRILLSLLAGLTILSWSLLSLSQPDLFIAQYNENAWRRGAVDSLDLDYLASLSPDALPVLLRLREEGVPGAGKAVVDMRVQTQEVGLNEESLSWWLWGPEMEEPALYTILIRPLCDIPLHSISIDYGPPGTPWGTQGSCNADNSPLRDTMDYSLTAMDLQFSELPEALEITVSLEDMEGVSYRLPAFTLHPRAGQVLDLVLTGSPEAGFRLDPAAE